MKHERGAKNNVRIWSIEKPYKVRELKRDSPKLNVWCGSKAADHTGVARFHVNEFARGV